MSTAILVIIGIVVLLALYAIGLFNKLVRMRNQVKNGWSQIDVQLQRRYDLIPNLVEAVKGYMKHERETLDAVIQARNSANNARQAIEQSGGPTETSLKDLMTAEAALKGSMTKIFALAESYPDLKASQNMQQLQEELATTENKVAFSRQSYNDVAMLYNTAQQEFPAVLFAAMLGHHEADLFQVDEAQARKAVKVAF